MDTTPTPHPPDRGALVEIDLQRWIVDAACDDAFVAAAIRERASARARGDLVVVTRFLGVGPGPTDYSDPGAPAAAYVEGCVPGPGDPVITKSGPDVFDVPELDPLLRDAGVTRVVLTGALTEYGVAAAARSAARRGYDVAVVGAACGGASRQGHERTLAELAEAGIEVTT